jgi:prolyl-tRNA editing enzyme YbaK/EbsC (Cys-tRNA(Pro) deacylase)
VNEAERKVLAAVAKIGAQTGVAYEVIEIDPEFSDTAAFCEQYGFALEQTCNTILVASRKGPKKQAACVVLAHTRLDVNKRVKHLLGVQKASFASAEEMTGMTGMQVGGLTPLALPSELPLYVDERVMRPRWIILGGGGRSIKIKVAPAILRELGAEVVEGLALEQREQTS